jgi:hypothetical protein
MLNESPSALNRVVTSLKVVALATVLGTVVLAAERQLIVAADTAPAYAALTSKSTPAPAAPARQVPADYFPSHFPAPQGEPAEPMPTF